jgi:serine/threonine protein phosphatase PrpC
VTSSGAHGAPGETEPALVAAGGTHPGLRRPNNEDSAYLGERLLVVADGMGGVDFGEVASAIVTHAVTYLDRCLSPQGPRHDLAAAVDFAEYRLGAAVAESPRLGGMGTTMTALLLDEGLAALAHVGDSRCYRLRGGRLEQITRDHTFVQMLVEAGDLTPEAAEHHPQRHVIVKALQGNGDAVIADVLVERAQPGDRWLVCSDGLCDFVERAAIAELLAAPAPADAVRGLIEAALEAGGPDNVTCLVADVVSAPAPAGGLARARHGTGGLFLGAAAELDPWGHRTDATTG